MLADSQIALLIELADKKVNHAGVMLANQRRQHTEASLQLKQLYEYQHEYYQKMSASLIDKGMRNRDLQIYQTFIEALNKVIARQTQQVAMCDSHLGHAVDAWRKEKRQLDAFMVLQQRVRAEKTLTERRQEQKALDEWAQRTAGGRDRYGN